MASQYGLAYKVDKNVLLEQLKNTYLSPTNTQPVFARIDNNIYIAPKATGTYPVLIGTIHYYERLAELSSDSDESGIPDEFIDFVLKKVVLEIDDTLGKLKDKVLASKQLDKDLIQVYNQFNLREAEENDDDEARRLG